MKYQLLAPALTLAFTCAAADGNWPQFRGPSGSGTRRRQPTLPCNGIPPREPTSPGRRKSPGSRFLPRWCGATAFTSPPPSPATPNRPFEPDSTAIPTRPPTAARINGRCWRSTRKPANSFGNRRPIRELPRPSATRNRLKHRPRRPPTAKWWSPILAPKGSSPIRPMASSSGRRISACKTRDGSSTRIRSGARPALR